MNAMNISILHYWNYDELFDEVKKGEILMPAYYLTDEKFLDDLISDIILPFEPTEAISYSAFLNMVAQTQVSSKITKLVEKEFDFLNIIPKSKKRGILFHRTNLLYLITLFIKKNNGSMSITGHQNKSGAKNFYKALSLVNNKLSLKEVDQNIFFISYLIRDHPYSYSPDTTQYFYIRWICRYWSIYKEIKKNSNLISQAIKCLETKMALSLEDYFYVIVKLFNWFIYSPLKTINKNNAFDINNINTFYIDIRKFPTDKKFTNFLKSFALDMKDIKNFLIKENQEDQQKSREYSDVYQNSVKFFHKPIFKIDNNNCCILDLKFLIEGICSGLIWQLHEMKIAHLPQLIGKYGYYLEKYFTNLLSKFLILEKKNDQFGPDAIVKSGENILLFEFTVEYYRIESMYSKNSTNFFFDLEKILFNPGKNESIRNKKDVGKFIKLNKYTESRLADNKANIIPILVTEKYLGDYDLLNWNGFLREKITTLKLNCIKDKPPLILCLDDLELFWRFTCSDKKKSAFQLVDCINKWKNCQKKDFLYNFSFFLENYFKESLEFNSQYENFFSFEQFKHRLKSK
jgi:hypothetical protein